MEKPKNTIREVKRMVEVTDYITGDGRKFNVSTNEIQEEVKYNAKSHQKYIEDYYYLNNFKVDYNIINKEVITDDNLSHFVWYFASIFRAYMGDNVTIFNDVNSINNFAEILKDCILYEKHSVSRKIVLSSPSPCNLLSFEDYDILFKNGILDANSFLELYRNGELTWTVGNNYQILAKAYSYTDNIPNKDYHILLRITSYGQTKDYIHDNKEHIFQFYDNIFKLNPDLFNEIAIERLFDKTNIYNYDLNIPKKVTPISNYNYDLFLYKRINKNTILSKVAKNGIKGFFRLLKCPKVKFDSNKYIVPKYHKKWDKYYDYSDMDIEEKTFVIKGNLPQKEIIQKSLKYLTEHTRYVYDLLKPHVDEYDLYHSFLDTTNVIEDVLFKMFQSATKEYMKKHSINKTLLYSNGLNYVKLGSNLKIGDIVYQNYDYYKIMDDVILNFDKKYYRLEILDRKELYRDLYDKVKNGDYNTYNNKLENLKKLEKEIEETREKLLFL